MLRKLVTCPDSAHLQEIEYLDHPLGILIARCSAFGDGCPIRCARTCARRMGQRKATRPGADPMVGTILSVRSCLRD